MWGRDLLVAPVFTKGATSRDVYLPKGEWYDWWTNARVSGGQDVTRQVDLATMPIYVRAGAIIPVDPVRQYTSEPVTEPTTLKVYRGADGEYTLYEDDGISQEYLTGERQLDADGVERPHQAADARARRSPRGDKHRHRADVQSAAIAGRDDEGSGVRWKAPAGGVLNCGDSQG